jgi:hypothetical protein
MEGHATTPAPSRPEVIVLAITALATALKDRAVPEENHEDDIEVNIVDDIIDDDDPSTVDFTYATSLSGIDLLHPFGMEPPLLETPEMWAERLRKLWQGDEDTVDTV